MGAVRDNNFFVVHGWMINQLGLKGNELQIYAIIYGFSQTNSQEFTGSLQYLADWTNSSTRTIMRSLQTLVENGLLAKRESYNNGVKACAYRCPFPLEGTDKMSPGVVTNCHGGTDKMSPNNIPDKDTDKNINNDRGKCMGAEAPPTPSPRRTSRFKPPTVEEVAAYCQERGNHVDVQRFVDYYTANGWKVGKNPMKDWKAAVRTWERSSGQAYARPLPARSRVKTEADYAAGMEGWG